ncbi:MAG: D-alanyl-D-alanine carboxypeptidase [Nitrospira sp.]|nr:D-alanyl-D-alanine carboxypeptidase [Nitrospira sp.]
MVAHQDGIQYDRGTRKRRQAIGVVGLGVALSLCLITMLPDVVSAKDRRHHRASIHSVSSSQQDFPWKKVPANSVLLKELRSGRVLYQHESEKRLSPASLTKIMSALVILEHGRLDEHATVSKNAARAPKTHLRLRTGEVFRLDDLLKAMLIVSANDACLAAVEHVGGTEEQFVEMMNAKVAQLGLTDTHFSNGCGFDGPEHYSTAEDLAKLSEVAMQNPVFRELVREERDLIMPVSGHRPYLLHTTNRLLGRIPGVEGVKTGFTSKAGRCLIAKVSQNGSDLLLVILNSNRRWNIAQSLISYGLRVSEPVPVQ